MKFFTPEMNWTFTLFAAVLASTSIEDSLYEYYSIPIGFYVFPQNIAPSPEFFSPQISSDRAENSDDSSRNIYTYGYLSDLDSNYSWEEVLNDSSSSEFSFSSVSSSYVEQHSESSPMNPEEEYLAVMLGESDDSDDIFGFHLHGDVGQYSSSYAGKKNVVDDRMNIETVLFTAHRENKIDANESLPVAHSSTVKMQPLHVDEFSIFNEGSENLNHNPITEFTLFFVGYTQEEIEEMRKNKWD